MVVVQETKHLTFNLAQAKQFIQAKHCLVFQLYVNQQNDDNIIHIIQRLVLYFYIQKNMISQTS